MTRTKKVMKMVDFMNAMNNRRQWFSEEILTTIDRLYNSMALQVGEPREVCSVELKEPFTP